MPVLPGRLANERIAGYDGKEVVIGVRPEDLHLEPEYLSRPDSGLIDTKVDIAEMMGSEILLYATFGNNSLIAKVSVKNTLKPGDSIEIAVDCNNIHLFDKETEQAIV